MDLVPHVDELAKLDKFQNRAKIEGMKSKIIRDALVSLDGMFFDSKEDVENAVYPLFRKLQEFFQGEGHRDLVDRLINARWLEVVKGKWLLTLPAPEKFPSATSSTPEPTTAFTTGQTAPQEPGIAKNNAMAAILRDDYKEAIRILTTLL